MIRREGSRLVVEGALTMHAVTALCEPGRREVAAADTCVDLQAVTDADSAGLALLLDWQRTAQAAGQRFEVLSLPAMLANLADVYGVAELLSARVGAEALQ